jgi:3-(3-hydroxy-phenyl)propionate hydroxylase
MLDDLGAAEALIGHGLVAPQFQYRSRHHGILGRFDFSAIADATRHPYRVQCEQSKLTRILYERLQHSGDLRIEFGTRVRAVTQDEAAVHVTVEGNGTAETRSARWLIGADGARSDVRRALDIAFDGFTWPERFLVVSTPYDFYQAIPGLVSVTYVADPERWHFLLQIPGLWRVMFPIRPDESDERCGCASMPSQESRAIF